jgi:hypothetical protein
MAERAVVVAIGSWRYDGTVSSPVFIVRLDHDFWYEVARDEDALEPGEVPDLDADGFSYYVSFHGIRDDGSFWPDSAGHLSVETAKAAAESAVPSGIRWSPHTGGGEPS